MKQLLITFCFFASLSAFSETIPSDFKEIKYGRKDLIRNDLIISVTKTVAESSNSLCKSFVSSYQSDVLTLRKYNDYLELKLKECKCK